MTGSRLTLAGTSPTFDVATGTTAVFDTLHSGTNGLVKAGAGTLQPNSTNNNCTGNTVINAGMVILGPGNNILPNTTPVTVAAGATMEISAGENAEAIAALSGAGHVNIRDKHLRVGDASFTTFSGVPSGSGGGGTLRKDGSGTVALNKFRHRSKETGLPGSVVELESGSDPSAARPSPAFALASRSDRDN